MKCNGRLKEDDRGIKSVKSEWLISGNKLVLTKHSNQKTYESKKCINQWLLDVPTLDDGLF